ncbi:MAG: exodeoxyribonuclease V subunit beta [Pantoea sp. Brub]|nr:exodeoxyribonuclease V subunit beta [Pantoea sp. Brub]
MTKIISLPLNPIVLPLFGKILIEASAGTGKTFTIVLLYLRLLLGLGNENAYFRPLSIKEILVVTFSDSATFELRRRIYNTIHQLRLDCIYGKSNDPICQIILEQIIDFKKTIAILLVAERDLIDKISVFTIHSFCMRMLQLNPYKQNIDLNKQLLKDQYLLLKESTNHFWYDIFHSIPLSLARIILSEWKNVDEFFTTIYPYFLKQSFDINDSISYLNTMLYQQHEKNMEKIFLIKEKWKKSCKDIFNIISNSNIDKRSYNDKNLFNWLSKITIWANSETLDYQLPTELKKFQQNNINKKNKIGIPPKHDLFHEIDVLYNKPLSLRNCFIKKALAEISIDIKKKKYINKLITFDDLINNLYEELNKPTGYLLSKIIKNHFPVALIDEFQDTDLKQYKIFNLVYSDQLKNTLILIGDPKQTIYSFRGADLSTYLHARKDISKYYTLNINWRSAKNIINSINYLFSKVKLPFLLPNIPYVPIKTAINNQELQFIVQNIKKTGLSFWLNLNSEIKLVDYEQLIAQHCAYHINNLLLASHHGNVQIGKPNLMRKLEASDITILVRNQHEANLIQNALNFFSIPSIYLSDNKNNIYFTPESFELLCLLKAIQEPKDKFIRNALTTTIFSMDSLQLNILISNKKKWKLLIKEFINWKNIWYKFGISQMIFDIMLKYKFAENIMVSNNGNRKLINLMHIVELLQEKYILLNYSARALISFLTDKFYQTNEIINNDTDSIRLEKNKNLIYITTIHKSKGLEYPIVWLPFATGYRKNSYIEYDKNNNYMNELNYQNANYTLDKTTIFEDLRLLYVALTRSIYHCSIGISIIKKSKIKKINYNCYQSAMGYLLQYDETNPHQIISNISNINCEIIDIKDIDLKFNQLLNNKIQIKQTLTSKTFTRKFKKFWDTFDYSYLINHSLCKKNYSTFNVNYLVQSKHNNIKYKSSLMIKHILPENTAFNQFMYNLLKYIKYNNITKSWVNKQIKNYNYPVNWLPYIYEWINCIVHKPLNSQGLTLNKIKNVDCLIDMKFHLFVNKPIVAYKLDALIRRYDNLSKQTNDLNFNDIKGILQGLIHLIFKWNNKYYIIDYKLNWLGNNDHCYTDEVLEQEIINKRYDIQYNIYTLVLHRYLKNRIHNYNYQKHFGGMFYLFIRGFNEKTNQNGIFTTYPNENLIKYIDIMFAKNMQ